MNQDYFEPKRKKSIRRIIIVGIITLLVIALAAAVGFFVTMGAVRATNDRAVKDEIITQNSRLRQSTVEGVLSGDSVARTKSTETVEVSLKVASDGIHYCIEAAFREDPKAIRYHMNEKTPELEPIEGLCGDKATERPATPAGFTLGSTGAGALSFTWGVIPDASSYSVECNASGQKSVTVKTRKEAATVEGLSSTSPYNCHVTAENSAGKSDQSQSVSATTKVYLAIPKEFKLTGRTATTLNFSWAAASDVKYYTFEYSTDPSFMKDVKKLTTTSSQTSVSGLIPETGYYAHVKVVTNTVTEQQAPFSEVVQGRTLK